MAPFKFHHLGHSFVKRTYQYISGMSSSADNVVGSPESCTLFVDGYSGLTYRKILNNPNYYLARLKRNISFNPVSVLSIDLGTNDLCSPEISVSVLIDSVFEFLELLSRENINPTYIVFFSVIKRTFITRPGQVSVECFNHRVKKFNKNLSKRLKNHSPWIHVFTQNRINFPKYLADGCHFTADGRTQYFHSLRRMMFKYRAFLQK